MRKPSSIVVFARTSLSNPLATSSKLNVISSNKGKFQQQLGIKKKGKGKNKKDSSPQDKQTNQFSDEKPKPHYPCLIFNEENFTIDCPHYIEVNYFLKSSTYLTVLTDLFPDRETHMVAWDPSSSNTVLMLSSTKHKLDVMVAT